MELEVLEVTGTLIQPSHKQLLGNLQALWTREKISQRWLSNGGRRCRRWLYHSPTPQHPPPVPQSRVSERVACGHFWARRIFDSPPSHSGTGAEISWWDSKACVFQGVTLTWSAGSTCRAADWAICFLVGGVKSPSTAITWRPISAWPSRRRGQLMVWALPRGGDFLLLTKCCGRECPRLEAVLPTPPWAPPSLSCSQGPPPWVFAICTRLTGVKALIMLLFLTTYYFYYIFLTTYYYFFLYYFRMYSKVSQIYISPFFFIIFPYRLLQNIE